MPQTPVSGSVSAIDALLKRTQIGPESANVKAPADKVREVLQAAAGNNPIGPFKRLELYYIRALTQKHPTLPQGVPFAPTFSWVVDAGLADLVGLALPYNIVGAGDPAFPDWTRGVILIYKGWTEHDVLWPSYAGKIQVSFKTELPAQEAKAILSKYGTNPDQLIGRHYSLTVVPLQEKSVGTRLVKEQPQVERWDYNQMMRLIDVEWRVDRLA